jgi:serine/threonine-protein kinase
MHHGLRLAQRYQLTEPIGRGALALVYQGKDLVLGRSIAVKAVPPEHIAAYRTALQHSSTLAHPAAIGIFDALEHDGWLFVVQEFVSAGLISLYFQQGVPAERAVDLARQIALALAHAHTHGVIHGDLTPTAVFVERNATVRLNNFGLPPDTAYFERLAAALETSLRSEDPTVELPIPPDGAPGAGVGGPLDARAGASIMDAAAGDTARAALVSPAGDTRAIGYLLWQLLTDPVMTATGDDQDEGVRRFRAEVPRGLRDVVLGCFAGSGSGSIDDPQALALALEGISQDLAQMRPGLTAATPPAIVAARAEARESPWSVEETVQGRRPWTATRPTAPTIPESAVLAAPRADGLLSSRAGGDRAALPLRVPTKAGDDVRARDDAPLWAVPQAQVYEPEMRRGGLPLMVVLLLGGVLFVLFFLVGYFSQLSVH